RGENGSSIPQQQKSYQLISENSFTGSSYNPVNTPEIKNNLSHTSKATNFHGFSSFITARSSLTCADLAQDPFVTYFNLGNGTFFKIDGETTFNHEWYNIGMQDYLPTWRWWWTSKYMGKSTSDATKTLTAEFTWNDAWFGGSCLQISGGTTSDVYLQLFKTKYQTAISGDYITIRYKVLSGTGSMAWACSTEDAPTTAVSQTIKNNAVPTGTWVKSRIQIANSRSGLKVQDAILAQIGLKFSNTTSDFKVLIGEMSLVREASETPAAPVIVKSRALASNYKGVDLKVIFKMNSSSSQPDIPVYNKDVKTWFFKVYAQQEGSTEIMCTTTTSWASYLVGVPYDKALGGRVRIGVSAVSLDGNSESNVTWGEWLSVPAATVVEGFSVSKSIIKAGEDFTVSFNDPNHPAAEWQVKYSKDDALKYSGTVHDFTMQLTEEGLYDLYLTMNGKTDVYRGMIQISPAEVGAMPKINSFTGNGHEDNISIKEGASVEFNYTGRADADGKVSRGVSLGGNGCGFSMSQIPGINNRSIFTVSFWLYINSLTPEFEGTTLLQIRYCKDGWPANNWGYMWCDINADSQYHLGIKDSDGVFKPGFEFKPGAWYHLAYVFDYSSQRDIHGYINGKYIGKKSAASPAWKYENQLLIGGKAANRSGLDGYIDELQFYNKALSAAEVEASMKHQTDIAPASPLIGYWDFESTPMADYTMKSTGSNKDLIAGIYEVIMLSESESDFKSQPFSFAPGAPFISGDVYKITTLPKWTYKGATVESSEGNASAGSSRVNYVEAGNYSATLTLENSWGSDSKTIKYISVTTGIENVTLDEMRAFPNPFIDEVYVRFENGGNYTVDIFDNAGRQVSSRNVAVETGGMVNIQVNGAPGVYFVKVKNDTTLFKAMKLIKQ
ncbi:MAG: LamG-like jellyroll fold domain-containing protein, partial [Bacteroidales bacterium]